MVLAVQTQDLVVGLSVPFDGFTVEALLALFLGFVFFFLAHRNKKAGPLQRGMPFPRGVRPRTQVEAGNGKVKKVPARKRKYQVPSRHPPVSKTSPGIETWNSRISGGALPFKLRR